MFIQTVGRGALWLFLKLISIEKEKDDFDDFGEKTFPSFHFFSLLAILGKNLSYDAIGARKHPLLPSFLEL